jgi:cytochrome b subunit of formate dehydrogenase
MSGEPTCGEPTTAEPASAAPASAAPTTGASRTYPRFSRGQRVQHAVLIASFGVLALTGLPQKYASTGAGETLIAVLGGIEAVRLLHRVAAAVLMAATLYHLFDVAYRILVRRRPLSMVPRYQDVLDAWRTVLYNLGRTDSRPRAGRYSFEEKVEYWALMWGNVVMIGTGFMLWNPIATTQLLSGQFIPAAQVAHGSEALLAVLAVVIWHGYGVHVRHLNRSMFTGTMTEEEMREQHPLELEAILDGQEPAEPEATALRRRRRLFLPAAVVLSLFLLGGLYRFVTFEETAIATLPRGERPVSGAGPSSP